MGIESQPLCDIATESKKQTKKSKEKLNAII